MYAGQSNTSKGVIRLQASGAITKNRLVTLVDATGRAKVLMPAADGAICPLLALDTCADGEWVDCLILYGPQTFRCVSTGTIAGAVAVMAETTTGYVKTAGTAGNKIIGMTLEDSTAGALVEIVPFTASVPA